MNPSVTTRSVNRQRPSTAVQKGYRTRPATRARGLRSSCRNSTDWMAVGTVNQPTQLNRAKKRWSLPRAEERYMLAALSDQAAAARAHAAVALLTRLLWGL